MSMGEYEISWSGRVYGTYLVDAESEEEAREIWNTEMRFNGPVGDYSIEGIRFDEIYTITEPELEDPVEEESNEEKFKLNRMGIK